MKMRQRS